jgi:hypothetical protein
MMKSSRSHSDTANTLEQDMRKLWTDHVVWTRDYLVAAVGDQRAPSRLRAAEGPGVQGPCTRKYFAALGGPWCITVPIRAAKMEIPGEVRVVSVALVALQWTELSLAFLVAIALVAFLLVPYLIKEIRDGKRDLGPLRRLRRGKVTLGPQTPSGAGDNNPGRQGDPAPGQPDGQADPYGARAQRKGTPVKS